MKIVHICISAPYIDGWGYQENLLPEYLNELNTENFVIASFTNFPSYLKKTEVKKIRDKGHRYQYNNTVIYRIDTWSVSSSFIVPIGLMNVLNEIKPDIIFHHNINSTSLSIAARYSKMNKCTLLVDNHADEINMSQNKLWVALYHKLIVRSACKKSCDTITRFFGVTYSRCEFINKYYKIPKSKIELLPIGADTRIADMIAGKNNLREKYGFSEKDFIVVSGGKMGKYKGTDILIRSLEELSAINSRIKLVLFGTYEDDSTRELAETKVFITQFGWCDRMKTLELLKLADVACWPIHHTTLIEDAISVETPVVLRKTGTTKHLINGNGLWVDMLSKDKLIQIFQKIIGERDSVKGIFAESCNAMKKKLSYYTVTNKIISYYSKTND